MTHPLLKGVTIRSTGSYIPPQVLTNDFIEKTHALPANWVMDNIGIAKRHIAASNESTSDLAVKAARQCLGKVDNPSVDAVILSTTTQDVIGIPSAPVIQDQLGFTNCAAYDVRTGCAGTIYALDNAINFIKAGMFQRVLVVASEITSRFTNYQKPFEMAYFSDGAGAILLESSNTCTHIDYRFLNSNDLYYESLHIPIGGSREHHTLESYYTGGHHWQACSDSLYKYTVEVFEDLLSTVASKHGRDHNTIDKYLLHPSHVKALEASLEHHSIPADKVLLTSRGMGHMSSASMAIALDESLNNGFIKPGDHVLMAGMGAGGNYGAIGLTIDGNTPEGGIL